MSWRNGPGQLAERVQSCPGAALAVRDRPLPTCPPSPLSMPSAWPPDMKRPGPEHGVSRPGRADAEARLVAPRLPAGLARRREPGHRSRDIHRTIRAARLALRRAISSGRRRWLRHAVRRRSQHRYRPAAGPRGPRRAGAASGETASVPWSPPSSAAQPLMLAVLSHVPARPAIWTCELVSQRSSSIGAMSICPSSEGLPRSRASRHTAAARPPPALGPLTTMRSGSMSISRPWPMSHCRPARQSSRAAGWGCSGARR